MQRCLFSVGTGLSGQLGLGPSVTRAAAPTLVRGSVRAVAASADASLAVFDSDPRLVLTTVAATDDGFAPLVRLPRAAAQLVLGKRHAIVRDVDGAVYGCGANDSGQLGAGVDEVEPGSAAVRLDVGGGGATVVHVAAGLLHSLAVTSDGAVYSCGASAFNELGHGSSLHEVRWRRVEPLVGVRAVGVAAGGLHSVVWTDDGRLFSFGRNDRGQLGTLQPKFGRVAPVELPVRVAAAACGQAHTLVLSTDGRVWAAGDNEMLQLGDAAVPFRASFLPVAMASGGATVRSIACGAFHSLACLSDGRLLAWGGGNDLQLGTGARGSSAVPTPTTSTHERWGFVEEAAGGWGHTLAIVRSAHQQK